MVEFVEEDVQCSNCKGGGTRYPGRGIVCPWCKGEGFTVVKKVVDTPKYDAKDDDKRFVLGED